MIHKLTIGHFDPEALKSRNLVVLRPLDLSVVTQFLREMGHMNEDGIATLGGHAVEFKDGYIVCPWLMPLRIPAAEKFAERLHRDLGCVLYDDTRREVVTPEMLAGS